jgi:hypothetical protein
MRSRRFPKRGASSSATSCCRAARRARNARDGHPRPAPDRARWRSIATGSVMREPGIAAVGLLVFAVLTAYHTIGGGALAQPYGDLVIFFGPPILVMAGVAVVLIGMYVQWIRWRMHKPLSFARYPQVGPQCGQGEKGSPGGRDRGRAPIRSSHLRRLSGLSLHGRRVVLRRRLPFHDAGVRHLPAVAARARGVRAMPCRPRRHRVHRIEGSRHGGTRGDHAGRLSAADSGSRDDLRPIRGNCEQCHWPAHFFGSRWCARCTSCPTSRTPAGRSTCWCGRRGRARGSSRKWEFTGMWRARWSMSRPTPRGRTLRGCGPWIPGPARPTCTPRSRSPRPRAGR